MAMNNPQLLNHKQGHTRNSNIELLRIVAMFMVLMLHVNFWSIGYPSSKDCITAPMPTFFRIAFELACIIAVNLFVFISGWFSIKASVKGICKFLFQCFFILTLTYCIGLGLGYASLTFIQIAELFFAHAWFVIAFLFLYILSPLINTFCNTHSEKALRYFIIAFYLLQTFYGNIAGVIKYTSDGYSPFSFIGVYVVARYMRLYGKKWYKYGPAIYIVSTLLLIVLYQISLYLEIPNLGNQLLKYTCPLNITACIGLVTWIANLQPRYNKIVNFIASSAFAVYLCHICLDWTSKKYAGISHNIYNQFSGISYLAVIFVFMLAVFSASILLDRIRVFCWNILSKHGRLSKSVS